MIAPATCPVEPADRADPALGAARACYLQNLAALYRRDPGLAAALDAVPFAQLPKLHAAQEGVSAQVSAEDGRPIWLHSRHQPRHEARRFVAALPEQDPPNFVVFGCGLGYHLLELEARYARPLLIVVEIDLALVKAALCTVDLRDALEQRRLNFLTSAARTAVHAALLPCSADLLMGFDFVTLPYLRRCRLALEREVRAAIADYVSFARVQVLTLITNAQVTCRNIAMNLPAYVTCPGVEQLKDRAAGYPALVIAAGPSLARALDQIGPLRDRAVLIAVQTVYKLLVARGTPPHFVTSLDYHALSAQFFDGVPEIPDCALVAEAKAHWQVLDAFAGRKYLTHADFAANLLRGAAPPHGLLKSGSTVAHLSFYLAQHLGCDPIILVGQDLAYSEGLYYPPGMPIEQIWQPELSRFQTIEMKQWERIVRGRPILRTVRDVHDRDVYTDDQLFTYAEQFQNDFRQSRARVIHAGEAGMRLEHTEVMSLREAAERYCTRPLPAALRQPPRCEPARPRRQAALHALAERRRELETLDGISAEMERLLFELAERIERPDEFNRRLARVDELRAQVIQLDQTYKLVTDASQMAELRRHSADRRLGPADAETPATARLRLRRDCEFVQAFRAGCTFLLALLPEAEARLRAEGAS